MKQTPGGGQFVVIGENIHATRTLARSGRHIVGDDRAIAVAFTDPAGEGRRMPLAAPIAASSDLAAGRVKHVRNALLLGLAGAGIAGEAVAGPPSADAAETARAYLVSLALRQQATGADWLDVNVDEVANDLGLRVAAMEWLVGVLEAAPEVTVPVSLDSSSSDVLAAGLRCSSAPHGPLLLNSASLERLDVLDLAVEHRVPAIVSAAGEASLPSDAAGRVANARRVLEVAANRGLPPADTYLDPLVMPAAVDPDAGRAFLDAAHELRDGAGSALHLTGGLSNVSFGLPARRLLNDVFLVLSIERGVDSGIIDPVSNDVERAFGMDRDGEPFRLAADLLEGRDAYGMEYLTAFRAGRLAGAL